jgi:hypothetical protein
VAKVQQKDFTAIDRMLGRADSVLILVSWYVVITYKHLFFYLRKILFKLIFKFSNTIFVE